MFTSLVFHRAKNCATATLFSCAAIGISWLTGEPVELENGATYIVEFPFTNHGPHPDVERMFALYEKGFWYSFSGDDATISVEDADYRVIRKVDLWAA
jgi:hypothetical protein